MSAFFAIVQDTWRQSKQQMVFIVMLVLLLLLALALIIIPKVYPESVRVLSAESGQFEYLPVSELTFEGTQTIALGDLDGDGDLDVVCGNGPARPDRIWINDGKGTFSSGTSLGDSDTRALALGDLDGDGDLDLIAGGAGPNIVYLNDGKGSFSSGASLGQGATATLALADLDGDRDLDLVVAGASGATAWINDGQGGFALAATVVEGDVRAIAAADLDNDGDHDLVIGRAGSAGNGTWLNDGKGSFTSGATLGQSDARAVVLGDFDGDSRLDVVFGNAGGERQELWTNQASGWTKASGSVFGFGRGGGGVHVLAVGDLNGDGSLDLVGGATAGQGNPIWINQAQVQPTGRPKGLVQFGPQGKVGGASELSAVAIGDLTGDGKPDILGVFPQRDLGFVWSDGPNEQLGAYWISLYGDTLVGTAKPEKSDEDANTSPEFARQAAAMMEAAKLAQSVPGFQRAVEAWLVIGAKLIFTLSMILFIVACSAYYPSLLAEGAVDVVLSRPVSRFHILAAKFVGGLALFSAAILATYLLVFVGIGIKTGIWHGRLFLSAPLLIFAAAVLYAILGCVGIVFRSTILAVILGLFFYIAVDSGLELLLRLQTLGVLEEVPKLEMFTNAVRVTLPNFGMLKDVSTMSVLNIPSFDLQPLVVAGAWMAICLGLGYWKFRSTDY